MTTDTAVRAEPKRDEWQALVPLSVGRRGDRDKAADFVPRGETIWLTEEESAGFLDPSRHRVPVIRPASQRHEPLPSISASRLYGAKGRPAPPVAAPGAPAALDVTNETRIIHPEGIPADVADPDAGRDGDPIRQPRRGRPPAA